MANSTPLKRKEKRTSCLCPDLVGVYPLVNHENLYTHCPSLSLDVSGLKSSPPIIRFLCGVCVCEGESVCACITLCIQMLCGQSIACVHCVDTNNIAKSHCHK